MMRSRNFSFVYVAICFVCLLSGCGGVETDIQTSVPVESPQQEIEATPISENNIEDFLDRPEDGMKMVYVPSGIFQMGSTESEIEDAITLCQEHYQPCNRWYYEREGPSHAVSLESFWIDQTEVSNAQYRQCVQDGVCLEPLVCKKGEPTYDDLQKSNHPVVCVSWQDAQTYCQWAGARLPTEAEWEYAFRGVDSSIFPWGDEFDGNNLNYCDANCSKSHADSRFDDGYPQTAPVGSYPLGASWSGALNMSGNIGEWVSDWLGDYSAETASNPLGPSAGDKKMLKGCSWFFPPAYCRGAARPAVDPDTRFDYIGFRCAESAVQEPEEGVEMILDSIQVPTGNPPTIDGIISSEEWKDATVDTFADGSEIYLKHSDGYLYLGIRSSTPEMIAGNIFIHRSDEIAILHSSAALGTAIYQKDGDHWQQIQDFTWRCRDSSESDRAKAAREAFFQEEGWVAANSRMGNPEELEYRVEITEEILHLAVNIIRSSNTNEKVPWPADLDDDCILLTPGGLPEKFYFSLEQWAILEILP